MTHVSCLVTGAIRIYHWYKNAELLTDASDPNVNKWDMSILAQPFPYSLAGLFRLRQYDMEPIHNRYPAFGTDEGPGFPFPENSLIFK